jgi:hypothetical protein
MINIVIRLRMCLGYEGMIKKDLIKAIGDKEMDRKDFLKYSGLAVAAVVGLKSIVTFLTQPEDRKVTVIEHKDVSRGFGGGKYGV